MILYSAPDHVRVPATTTDMLDVFFLPKLTNTPSGCVAIFDWTDTRLTPPAPVRILFGASLNDVGALTRVLIRPHRHTVIFNAKTATGNELSVAKGMEFLALGAPGPRAGDGALANRQGLESPQLTTTWFTGGYGIPPMTTVELHSGGDELNGVTLTRPDNQATAPICFVFTTSTGDPAKASRVAVHELTHVLELPHQCGFWDFHTDRAATCCMTYATQWALIGTARHHVDDNLAGRFFLTPGTLGKTGADHCGKHIKEARRVHFEDHPGLKWK